MVAPIQSLANMEYMLYGSNGYGLSAGAPSMVNNYTMQNPYSQYGYPYGVTGQYPTLNSAAQQTATTAGNASGTVSQSDVQTLANYYEKGLSEQEETLLQAAKGGVAFAAISNPRVIAHPFNSLKSSWNLRNMFKACNEKGSALNKLWTDPKTNELVRDAYFQMHKAEARSMWKLGLFRKRYTPEEYSKLKDIMEKALASGDKNEIAKATETLKNAYVTNGHVPTLWGKFKNKLGFESKVPTVTEKLGETTTIAENAQKAVTAAEEAGSMSLKSALSKSLTFKNCALWVAFEFLGDFMNHNIQDAFSKDTSTGMKQLGQTTVKGAAAAVGWVAGEALGAWGAAKLCAAAGTAIAPGVGTVIGAVAGFVGGSIGMWLLGKGAKKIIGKDQGEKVRMERMKKTPEGHVQLLQLTAQQAQNDKNLDPRVLQSINNLATSYSSVA